MASQVAILRTRPETVVEDYGRLMRLVKYDRVLRRDQDLVLKLNLSWTKYFPACSSQPWQLDGVLRTLLEDGFARARLFPVENKTVVTNPLAGCRNNRWEPVLRRHGLPFIPLPDVEWVVHRFQSPLLRLNEIFPEGIEIPKMYVGKNVLHLPTVKCVHPDTEIVLADGSLVRAEALVKEWQVREPTRDLPDGDRVSEGEVRIVSLDGSSLTSGHATHFWRTPVGDGTVWTVRTRTGREVTTSPQHPFLTPEGWTPAARLRVGDRIAIARRIRVAGTSQPLPRVARLGHEVIDVDRLRYRRRPSFDLATQKRIVHLYLRGASVKKIAEALERPWSSIRNILRSSGVPGRGQRNWVIAPDVTSTEFCRWLGYFTAEGWARDNHSSLDVSMANGDTGIQRDYTALCRRLFRATPVRRGITIGFCAQNLRPFFESLGFSLPTSAATKAVPDVLFRCPDAEIAAFLQGYLDGDGTVCSDGVHVTTKSQKLARQVQMLLARLGVVSFIRHVRCSQSNRRRGWTAVYAKVSIHGDDVVRLAQWIQLKSRHKRRRLAGHVFRRKGGSQPSHWDTVPLPPALFRMVREGLGFTHASTGMPAGVSNIEIRRTEATRRILARFIGLFSGADSDGRFANELAYMRLLASEDIAWDRVDDVYSQSADSPFLYDLSVRDTHSFVGNGIILHNTHGHSTTTGAIKNSFGGLLKEVRHYAHEYMHEVLVDLMYMQRELHPSVLAVMDGTVMGDGAGPRTMVPRVGNLLLASEDQVAIDAIAARIMGFDPLAIPYLRMCAERGLGTADPKRIELVGDTDLAELNLGFRTRRSLVIWGDQLIRRGPLRPLKRLLLHSPLVVWAPFASNVYHDLLWYPTVGRARIRAFAATPWGRLFATY